MVAFKHFILCNWVAITNKKAVLLVPKAGLEPARA